MVPGIPRSLVSRPSHPAAWPLPGDGAAVAWAALGVEGSHASEAAEAVPPERRPTGAWRDWRDRDLRGVVGWVCPCRKGMWRVVECAGEGAAVGCLELIWCGWELINVTE